MRKSSRARSPPPTWPFWPPLSGPGSGVPPPSPRSHSHLSKFLKGPRAMSASLLLDHLPAAVPVTSHGVNLFSVPSALAIQVHRDTSDTGVLNAPHAGRQALAENVFLSTQPGPENMLRSLVGGCCATNKVVSDGMSQDGLI
ncbi:hypothetical protein CH63R_04471 [Colletotrichum higginsianum IMI 349063]|uniref:Uncharacterized protein n=1 Tax=Colletotrichum higginsianum (strain IMI 349063) TaxID=759273 RepID=A0A1B7YJI8_COLHI|nr:hypothetical protein CH63R_04471 [Colletotrichum higginsianum IMI 349063]OBR12175.1 hypothetical protein CH63R_04471 [Colletotrichum higginsianum IMI 349063]